MAKDEGQKLGEDIRRTTSLATDNTKAAKQLGISEADAYLSGKLRAPQEKLMQDQGQKDTSEIESYAKHAGLSKEQQDSMMNGMKVNQQILKDSMLDASRIKALGALGYSQRETIKLLQESKRREMESKKATMQLYSTLAMVGVAVMTAGVGTAAAETVVGTTGMTAAEMAAAGASAEAIAAAGGTAAQLNALAASGAFSKVSAMAAIAKINKGAYQKQTPDVTGEPN